MAGHSGLVRLLFVWTATQIGALDMLFFLVMTRAFRGPERSSPLLSLTRSSRDQDVQRRHRR